MDNNQLGKFHKQIKDQQCSVVVAAPPDFGRSEGALLPAPPDYQTLRHACLMIRNRFTHHRFTFQNFFARKGCCCGNIRLLILISMVDKQFPVKCEIKLVGGKDVRIRQCFCVSVKGSLILERFSLRSLPQKKCAKSLSCTFPPYEDNQNALKKSLILL